MKTVRISGKPGDQEFAACVMALGNFDGVHKGHRQIIEDARTIAAEKGVQLAVMTFEPHPRQVLGAGAGYDQQLTPLPMKIKRFQELNVDICYVVEFDLRFAAVSADRFVEDYLLSMNAAAIVAGFDYRFGAGGRSDVSTLKALLENTGKTVRVVPAVNLYGEKVSTSFIREKLLLGEVKLAAELLGRPYEILGEVVHGEGRGKLLGFPTANIAPSHRFVLPRTGVYLIRGHLTDSDGVWQGLMNVGHKPTFRESEQQISLEAHLFRYSGDLYGQRMTIEFLDYLRPEKRFNSAQELIEQIHADAAEAQRRFHL